MRFFVSIVCSLFAKQCLVLTDLVLYKDFDQVAKKLEYSQLYCVEWFVG